MARKKTKNALTYPTLPALFTGICNAIREKTGDIEPINHQDIPELISNISGAGGDVFTFNSGNVICDESITVSEDGTLYALSWETNITNSFGIIKNSGAKTQGTTRYNSGNQWCRYFVIPVNKGDVIRFKSDYVYPGNSSLLTVVACVIPS